MSEEKYLLLLSSFVPFGPKRLELLIKYFKSAKNVWSASPKELINVGLKDKMVEDFDKHRKLLNAKEYFQRLKKLGISFVVKTAAGYPENLREFEDSPLILYVRGKLCYEDNQSIAIVGARKMTSYGKEVTENFTKVLAGSGLSIISGLARGIDTQAHRTALEVGGRTVAVLACGLNKIYPPENTPLAIQIIKSGGALISEYPLNYPAFRANFCQRNRIISGVAKAVLVVEGVRKSGSLLTSSHAANQGRTVYAVPGQITSPMSGAPHFLIQNGAKAVFDPADIIEDLGVKPLINQKLTVNLPPGDKKEKLFLEILTLEELHLDEVSRISGLSVSEVSAKLTIMEMKGLIRCLGNGIYKKN